MTVLEALAILEAATLECKKRNVDTPEVHDALTLLEPHVQPEWLVQQFRHHALKARGDQIFEREGQQQVLRPSFEGIRIPSVIYSVNGWTRSRGNSTRLTT